MARKITLKQAIAEMATARADFQRFFGDVDPDHAFLCIDCNDETPIGCPVCCDKDVEILMHEVPEEPAEEAEPRLLREDAFPPARDEPAHGEHSPRPEFLEPEPVSPRTTKRATRAAQIARWRKANGWTGPFVRFAGEDADCYDAE